MEHHLGLAKRTQIRVCKSPSYSAGTAVSRESSSAEGSLNPIVWLWGRTLGESWPSESTSSHASIDFWCQLVASPATTASWMSVVSNGGLRILGWIGQLLCLTIFSTSLSVAAFLHRAGGSMFNQSINQKRIRVTKVTNVTVRPLCWRALEAMGEV